jgi:hypothetical protein
MRVSTAALPVDHRVCSCVVALDLHCFLDQESALSSTAYKTALSSRHLMDEAFSVVDHVTRFTSSIFNYGSRMAYLQSKIVGVGF